ncbi:AAA family ATPase [Saccharomonospora sp. NPDC006951]
MTEPAAPVAVHETHIGVVFLLGERAYKLKKPVDFGFVDFSDPSARKHACEREVELNRRLAPDVYLGVSEVSGVRGEPADYLVVMTRMPEHRRLTGLVTSLCEGTADEWTEQIVHSHVRQLARMMASFHSGAERGERISEQGGRDAILRRWRESFDQVRDLGVLDPGVAAEIERRTEDFLAGRQPLFARRIAEGKIVDGHGDLLTGDIFCLDDGPRVLDCLEFDDRLRWLDGLDDIAFLAMDLERLGASALAASLLEDYAAFAGDPAPSSLRHHYIAYRAFVRAKVACLRAGQGDEDAAAEAREYAALALAHLREGQPRLILVGGLPGTGKSTLAGGIADRLGAVLIGSDRLRKELAGRSPSDSAAAGYRDGLYSERHSEHTYEELARRAAELLGQGETVVLDASWIRESDRARAREVASATNSTMTELRCVAPAEVGARRIAERRRAAGTEGTGPFSDADAAIATAMSADSDEWPAATDIDTSSTPVESLDAALTVLAAEQQRRP